MPCSQLCTTVGLPSPVADALPLGSVTAWQGKVGEVRWLTVSTSQLGATLGLELLFEHVRLSDAGEEMHLAFDRTLGERLIVIGPLTGAHVPLGFRCLHLLELSEWEHKTQPRQQP